MAKQQVRIDGLDNLTQDFNKLSKAFSHKQLEKAGLESAKIITQEAKRRAPRGPTGNLKRSIKEKTFQTGFKGEITSVLAAVDRRIAPHAHFVEEGTSHMAAQPFFRPAVMSKSREAANKFQNELERMVNGAVK